MRAAAALACALACALGAAACAAPHRRPGWSTIGNDEVYDAATSSYLVTGGTPAGMAHADRAADTELRRFLEENL